MIKDYEKGGLAVSDMLRRTWTEIHFERLQNNIRLIRHHLHPGCLFMAMVKADAYGHGAVPVARAMARYGVDWFGVSNLEEAIQLRRAGITQPILIVSYTPAAQAACLAEYNITQTVMSADYAEELSHQAVAAGVRLSVHIKLDTGMSRVGFVCHDMDAVTDTVDAVAAVCHLPGLQAEGIFTHFASADEQEDDGYTRHQFDLFSATVDALAQRCITFALRHCCNSAATLRFPEFHLNMVRPGILLYGLLPDSWMKEVYPGFQPVMELKTTVSMVKSIPADRTVSYNRTYRTAGETRLATVSIGYGDGYARCMSNRAYMLVAGGAAPVIGRVCMDQCMLDVTALPTVQEGSVVTVFGSDGGQTLPADRLAAWMDTIHYEVICLVSKRVPRLYWENGRVVEQLNYILSE